MATSNHTMGLTPDELRKGLAEMPEDIREKLHWLYGYGCTLGEMRLLATQMGFEPETIKRVWRGSQAHATAKFLERLDELRKRVSRQQVEKFAVTEVTDAIWRACDLAMAEGGVVAIVGPTGSGKTATLRQWQAANNHGRAVYLDVPAPCGQRRLADALAMALGFNSQMSKKGHEIYDLLNKSVTSRNVLILDEIGRMLPNGRGHDVSALEFVRRLHDANGCGLVMSMTATSHRDIACGAMSGYLEQLLGRFADVVVIPEYPMAEEVEAIVRQYVPEPTPELLTAVGQFAASGAGRLRSMCAALRRVAAAAARSSQPVTVTLWLAAVAHLQGQNRFRGTLIKPRR